MEDNERRYYIDKIHDYANFQGIIRGYILCFNEGAMGATNVLSKMEESEKQITAKLSRLEVKHAEKG
jgi:hypothetical protein